MAPIHRAARDGDLAEVNRLVAEDGQRLDARDYIDRTPLMLAAYNGHDAVVGRLIELGVDVLAVNGDGSTATHWACCGEHASTLALLLDAGAQINACNNYGTTPLMSASSLGATECVNLLLARGGGALEVDARINTGWTALHYGSSPEIKQLLLQAGADPTIRNNQGHTPLDVARDYNYHACIPLLEAAVAEPQRPRLLLKARALLDAAHKIREIQLGNDGDDDSEEQPHRRRMRTRSTPKRRAVAAAPAYLKQRVEQDQQLPRVSIVSDGDENEELVACLKYALGLAYGGGVHFEGEEQPVGMLREVFVELCELLVPTWERANV